MKRIARLLRAVADKIDPQPAPNRFYMSGLYYDGRNFVLANPAITLYGYRPKQDEQESDV